MRTSESGKKAPLPAYVSYRTFLSFIDDLAAISVPSHIDRSIMPKMSGGTQGQLLAALRFLGLIDPHGVVQQPLRDLVDARGDKDKWNDTLSGVLETAYAPVFEAVDLDSATGQTLTAALKTIGPDGSTLRKCYRFFVQAAVDAGQEVSPHIKKGGPKAPARKKKAKKVGELPERSGKQQKKDDAQSNAGDAAPMSPGTIRLPLFFPGKPQGYIVVPDDLDDDDCAMIDGMVRAYAARVAAGSNE